MRIKLFMALILLILTFVIGCSSMSTADQQKMVKTATPISTQYIKQYYNAEFVVTSHDVDNPSIHSRLYLYGYVTGHEDERITVSYNYDTLKVLSVDGPGWFIDSRNPKKEISSP